ncbi:MAG: YfhO family protein [Clostridia bacterium]|nr:YfhO family protein [Clostridia bacterium]
MKPLQIIKKRTYLLETCLLALVTALLSFGAFLFRNGGFFTIVDDFNAQQIPFTYAVSNALDARPLGGWFWGIDLGTSLVGTFGFYNLGSPFFWISCLFPVNALPYVLGWIYVLKYVVAACTAYLFLERFCEKKTAAMIGALVYAFSGFQSINLIFYHFHDVVAFFPLLLLGLELAADDDRYRPFFIFTVFLNCLTNYFFFIGEVIFLTIYFLYRFRGMPLKALLKTALNRLLDGVLGVGMACVLFIPSIVYVLGNIRSKPSIYLENFIYGSRQLLHLLKGMLLPPDVMRGASAAIQNNWKSTSCYLPLFGLSFVLAYLRAERGRKNWLCGILIVCFLLSLSPLLQSAFTLFTDVYQRWWYMFVLIMVLAVVKVLDHPDSYPIKSSIVISVVLTAVFYLSVRFIPWNEGTDPLVFDLKRFTVQFLLAVVPAALLLILSFFKRKKYLPILVLTVLCCAATTAFSLYHLRNGFDAERYKERFFIGTQLEAIDEQYRYAASDDETDDSILLLSGKAAPSCGFCSTLEPSSYYFDRLFEMKFSNRTSRRINIKGLSQLLGAKYVLNDSVSGEQALMTVSTDGAVYTVTEQDACPIGFSVDQYMTESQLLSLEKEDRVIALMQAFVVRDADETKIAALTDAYSAGSGVSLSDAIAGTNQRKVEAFRRDATGFSCESSYDRDTFVYFTVPFEQGWTAYIDGEPVEIIFSGGMMVIAVPKGAHSIVFRYHTPGLTVGAIVSLLSFVGFAVITVAYRLRCRRTGAGGKKKQEIAN